MGGSQQRGKADLDTNERNKNVSGETLACLALPFWCDVRISSKLHFLRGKKKCLIITFVDLCTFWLPPLLATRHGHSRARRCRHRHSSRALRSGEGKADGGGRLAAVLTSGWAGPGLQNGDGQGHLRGEPRARSPQHVFLVSHPSAEDTYLVDLLCARK